VFSGLRLSDSLTGVAERLYRAQRIGLTFGRVYLGIKSNQLIARRLRPPDMAKRWSHFNRESAESIYQTAVELRGLILKGCQFIGSRADVLPTEYIETLSRLQDRVPPKSFDVVRDCVEEELGAPLHTLFASFSERPIASASLAQVHEARLHSGERVAVKVQYPEIAALVTSDLANLRTLFRAVGVIEKDFDLMPLVEEFGKHVPLELDFINEGHNAERVAAFYSERDDIYVPKIYWDYTTRRVLVMEFVEGIKISDAPSLRAAGLSPQTIMQTLVEAYCEQILVRGFFHADPHPGNLIVQPGPPARVVFVDFGLAKELPAEFQRGVVSFASALLGGQPDTMARALLELGFETRSGGSDSAKPLAALAERLLAVATLLRNQSYIDRNADTVRDAAEDLVKLIREDPIVRVPSHIIFVGRVLGLLSGLGRTLDAKLDMVSITLPYVARAAQSANAQQPDSDATQRVC
jgi:predicted unusual protein kinase regulating ubiquinone biosynthesis (AarF/ABC1/UbiB family)